ncbi:MAG: cupin domain-containing protein, partial [Treponema sp.]|nr:cupin domain-containing protein [Treponema sp.]
MFTLRLREDRSEDISYTSFNLPIRSIIERLSSFHGYTVDCHWHPELEFIIVLEGEMTCHVNNKFFSLAQGDGIFLNANQFHFGRHGECGGGGGGLAESLCFGVSRGNHPGAARFHILKSGLLN